MFRLLTALLVATLMPGCASKPAPSRVPPPVATPSAASAPSAPTAPAPLPTWPLAGCERQFHSLSHYTLRCEDADLLVLKGDYAELRDPLPKWPFRDLLAGRLIEEEGYTARQPVRLALPGGEVEALRLTGSVKEPQTSRVAYLAERPGEPASYVVSCALPRDTPEGLARCERWMDAILRYEPSVDEPRDFVATKVEALLGEKVELGWECELVGANPYAREAPVNGQASCGKQLTLTWSGGHMGRTPAEEYARMGALLQQAQGAGSRAETRTCTLRGRRVPCVRFTHADEIPAPKVGYLGVSQEEPALLVICVASEDAPPMRALCERLFAPEGP